METLSKEGLLATSPVSQGAAHHLPSPLWLSGTQAPPQTSPFSIPGVPLRHLRHPTRAVDTPSTTATKDSCGGRSPRSVRSRNRCRRLQARHRQSVCGFPIPLSCIFLPLAFQIWHPGGPLPAQTTSFTSLFPAVPFALP